MIVWVLILAVVFISSYLLTFGIKKYAEQKSIIDIPNIRSSHKYPTPRGGGLSFLIIFLFSVVLIKYFDIIQLSFNHYEFFSLGIIGLLGFCDDRISLSPYLRLIVQFIAVCIFLISLLPISPLVTKILVIKGIPLNILILFYLVWLINLYNFMDGINGIASLEAVSVSLGMVFVYWLTDNLDLIPKLLILVAAVLGFLFWNFPKAKIFMGDAGSNFLGLIIGMFSVQSLMVDSQLIWSWFVLLGVFIVDASITLLRRFFNGEKIYLAHCNHAYQHLARRIGKHTPVTLLITFINIIWLLPIAILIGKKSLDGFYGLLIAYTPLCVLAYIFGSGNSKIEIYSTHDK